MSKTDEIEARALAATADLEASKPDDSGYAYVFGMDTGYDGEMPHVDAVFIANARADVLALVARVRELESGAAFKEACDRNHVRGQREMRDRIVEALYRDRDRRPIAAALREFPVESA